MEEMKKTSVMISQKLEDAYSPEGILLRRCFINYMHSFYTMAFARSSSPKMDIRISGSAMEGFNPLRFSALLQEGDETSPARFPTASDVDIMCIFQKISAADTARGSQKPGILRLTYKDDNPGYVQLSASEDDYDIMKDVFSFLGTMEKYIDTSHIIDSERFCGAFYMYLETVGYSNIYNYGDSVATMMGGTQGQVGIPYRHGPAATNAILLLFGIASETNIIDYDLVPAIRVPVWPIVAEGWRRRLRQWPGRALEEQIVSAGCHVVPVGNTTSESQKIDWRLSFSLAESMLINSWNGTQQKTYILIKALCYQHLHQHNGLRSYHMKTAMFWACEREAKDFWTEENLIGCVRQVLVDLRECCKSHNLLHYFVTGNNLLAPIDTTALNNAVAKIDKILYDGLSPAILACPYIFGSPMALTKHKSDSDENMLESKISGKSESSKRLHLFLEQNLEDWDVVCAEIAYGTKQQMYTGNEDKTIENLQEELKKIDIGLASTDNEGNSKDFMYILYKQVILENLAWLLFGKAIWETDETKKTELFKRTELLMKQSTESGSRSALAKYAYFLYKTGKYDKSMQLCEYLTCTSYTNSGSFSLKRLDKTNLVDEFELIISEHVPQRDVVFKAEDHYALVEPLYSMVAAAPHFFSLQPRAFCYIVLALCYHAKGDRPGLELTLKEYSWYAKQQPTSSLQGKELVVVAVLYHHFGYTPEAILHSQTAATLDKRFSHVAEHIETRNKSSLGNDVLGWVRGVVFSTFVAHTIHYIGAECVLEWAEKYF